MTDKKQSSKCHVDGTPWVEYRFNEDASLKELRAYIDATYSGPYVGKNNIQAFDMIKSCGHGLGFCIGNAIKYACRYGKKEGYNRKDVMKALHYLMMALYVIDDEGIK
jgi:hypothetical protein